MINKKNMWFLTLFSLILVLSVYYITMPTELLIDTKTPKVETTNVEEQSENSTLVALRVEKEENSMKELEDLNKIITDVNSSVDAKNEAYDKMKNINEIKGEEEQLEKQIQDTYKFNSVVTINGDKINVVVNCEEGSIELANKIMRTLQENYENKMFISVKFEK